MCELTLKEKRLVLHEIIENKSLSNNDIGLISWLKKSDSTIKDLSFEQKNLLKSALVKSEDLEFVIEKIKNNISPFSKKVLTEFIKNDDPYYRLISYECLNSCFFDEDDLAGINIAGLEDSDELVRIECAEYLGLCGVLDAVDSLILSSADNDELVRSSSIISLAQIGGAKAESYLGDGFLASTDRDRMSLLFSEYILDEKFNIENLFDFINNEDYQIRCSLINLLVDFVKDKDVKTIKMFIEENINGQDIAVVKETLERALSDLK